MLRSRKLAAIRFYCGAMFALMPALPATCRGGEAEVYSPEAIEFFETKVRPVLADKCFSCHGEKTQWSSFRLDSREALLAGGDNGEAIVVGSAADSPLMTRVASTDPADQMPPPGEGTPLTAAEVEALATWINRGAAWPASSGGAKEAKPARDHWAFQPVQKPSLPEVKNSAWARGAIDQFVLARLEAAGLAPSPQAGRRTLIRRVTYDLTGLPPTPEEVDSFVADSSPEAYERLVDRLLASPAYGEHWGRHWLDVARYADSKGYVYAREESFFVHSSLYRDWVVKAFNDDLPYDQFLLLQLAADQVAPGDPMAAPAMGFLTLGRRFLGVEADIIDDRIDVVTRGTMGLTVSCARCHDHKFDPVPTADYYSLYGVFQNCAEVVRELPRPQESPDGAEGPAFYEELARRKSALAEAKQAACREFSDLARRRIDEYLRAQWELDKYPEQTFSQISKKEDVLPATVRKWHKYLERAGQRRDPVFTPWIALAKIPTEDFARQAPAALAAVDLSPQSTNPKVAAAFATAPTSVDELVGRYARLFHEVDQTWRELVGDAEQKGLPAPTALPDPADEQLRQVLYGEGSPCVIPDLPMANIEFDFDIDTCVGLWKLQSDLEQWILKNPAAVPRAVVLEDKRAIANPRIFRRGNPANPGDEVPLRFLEILSGSERKPFSQGSGRYELAQAIASPDNPLTSRVWVNRVWAHLFGDGLVRTPSDFGTRAEPPSHPELLDWLAHQFVAEGWSTKKLHRAILLSATYQQSATGHNEATSASYAAVDPENRLLWRKNPRRLSFEELRDTYLAISGDLDPRLGGKGSHLFASTPAGYRRTLYSTIDRQLLPGVLLNFDFANPDLHSPQRSETTVPQQALFSLNHMFVADRARALVASARSATASDPAERVSFLYRRVLQRAPTEREVALALEFLASAEQAQAPDPVVVAAKQAWSYGYGEIDPEARRLRSFTPLPHFASTAWQGGTDWPSPDTGWAQITADGGHPGDDLAHAIVRRWTAPVSGTYQVRSTVKHTVPQGDGIRCWIMSSRDGALAEAVVHNADRALNVDEVTLAAGDTLEFVVDILKVLNSDQHHWAPEVSLILAAPEGEDVVRPASWHAQRDFTTSESQLLGPWEQLAHVLLISNELVFVD